MRILFDTVIPTPMREQVTTSEVWLQKAAFEAENTYQIVAPSGTGKTSLLHILFGIRKDYDGAILFDNTNIAEFSNSQWDSMRRNKLSIVFQGLKLFPELNAIENIQIKNKLSGFKTKEQIIEMLITLGLEEHMHKKAQVLSFGQQQRVALVRALCQPFEFLLLDEPFSHLDNTNISRACQLIAEESKQQGGSTIITLLHNNTERFTEHVWHL